MKLKSWMILGVSALTLASVTYVNAATESNQVAPQAAALIEVPEKSQAEIRKPGETVAYADRTVLVEQDIDGQHIVTKYEIGVDGSFRSEIIEHTFSDMVGALTVWDTETLYSYDPLSGLVTIDDSFEKNERIVPSHLLTSLLPNNLRYNHGQAKKVDLEGDFEIYKEGKEKFKVDKKDGLVKEIELLDDNGAVNGKVKVKEVKAEKHDKSKFKIDTYGKKVQHIKKK